MNGGRRCCDVRAAAAVLVAAVDFQDGDKFKA